jgi:hypothetical protein
MISGFYSTYSLNFNACSTVFGAWELDGTGAVINRVKLREAAEVVLLFLSRGQYISVSGFV